MSWLEPVVQHPIAIAISRTVLHSLWEAAIVAIAAAVVLRALRSSDARYGVACGALVAMVAVLITTFIYVFPQPQFTTSNDAVLRSVRLPEQSGAAAPAAPVFRLDDLMPWITPFWAAGVFLFSLRQLASWIGARRLRRRGVCIPSEEWRDRFNAIRSRLGLARPAELLESCFARVPIVVGHARPLILVPVGLLSGLPPDQVELILLHELAHVRRRDYLVNMIQTFLEGILFYNPAVWWISNVIRTEREHCCDDVVVSVTHNSHAYAAALAALAENRSGRTQFVLAASGGDLVKRIRRLISEPERPGLPLLPLFAAGLLVMVTTVVVAAPPLIVPAPPILLTLPAPVAVAPEAPAPKPAPAQAVPALQRWLEEDVVYIITDEERRAYQNLTGDAERGKFIEQFWERRDPTPATASNEMKNEHYNRIAYTNQMFSIPSKAGWQTDRGRILIMFGKPEEIESHPSGGIFARPQGGGLTTTFPFEIWRYRYIEGIGNEVLLEFVDSTRSGDFRLTTPLKRAAVEIQRAAFALKSALHIKSL